MQWIEMVFPLLLQVEEPIGYEQWAITWLYPMVKMDAEREGVTEKEGPTYYTYLHLWDMSGNLLYTISWEMPKEWVWFRGS